MVNRVVKAAGRIPLDWVRTEGFLRFKVLIPTVIVRPLESKDIPRLREIHEEMGSDYPFPDLQSDMFVGSTVIVNEDDVPVMLVACRKTVEAFLLMDKAWKTPKWRLASFGMLHERVMEKLKVAGYDDVNAWLPPAVVKSFGKRLVAFGWVKGTWQNFSKRF
jgi:hypothetical protein